MDNITKVSDITYEDVANYIRLSDITEEEQNTLNTLLKVSKSFIKDYTGQTDEGLDKYESFVIVVFVLCQDMWDNRTFYVDNTNLNFVVSSILDMHSVNLLPDEL